MISYDKPTIKIKVRLEGKHVGSIIGDNIRGYWYEAKGGESSEAFATVEEVKRRIQGDLDELG